MRPWLSMNKLENAEALAAQVMAWSEELGQISQSQDYLDRRYLTPEHKQANQLVAGWMEQADMHTWQDSVANLWGRFASEDENAPVLLMGSHLDTVPNGGKYDGMLGVLAPVALIQALHKANIKLPFHIDVVGFCDEEGTRFGSTLLGSRGLTGQWQKEWADLKDQDGISLRQAMVDFGLDFDLVHNAKLDNPTSLLGYLETHIEQGPVLEANYLPVGVVTAIAGAKRFKFTVTGSAGHAGTVPMNLRRDALAASAEMHLSIEKIAAEKGVVATVGVVENRPNSVNVISGKTAFSLDIRSKDDQLRDEALDAIILEINAIAARRNVTVSSEQTHSAQAVECDVQLQQKLIHAIELSGIKPFSLFSGAGHDAMAMADICPVSMLFVRCDKGISHHPAEAIEQRDVEHALNVLFNFVMQL